MNFEIGIAWVMTIIVCYIMGWKIGDKIKKWPSAIWFALTSLAKFLKPYFVKLGAWLHWTWVAIKGCFKK